LTTTAQDKQKHSSESSSRHCLSEMQRCEKVSLSQQAELEFVKLKTRPKKVAMH